MRKSEGAEVGVGCWELLRWVKYHMCNVQGAWGGSRKFHGKLRGIFLFLCSIFLSESLNK